MDEKILFEAEIKVTDSEFQEKIKESQNNAIALREELKVLNKTYAIMQAKQEANTEAAKNLAKQIKEKKTLLQNEVKTVKSYTAAMDMNSLSANQLKQRMNEVTRALHNTSKELNPDAWKKYNSELKTLRARHREVTSGTEEVSGSFSKLFSMLPTKTAFFSALFSGAIGVLKKASEETQTFGDFVQQTFTGIEWSYKSMLQTITTGDWSHLFSNMLKAYSAGKQFQTIMDEIFELQNSQTIQETKLQNEIAKLQLVMDDVTKSDQERLNAAAKIETHYKTIGDMRRTTAEQEMIANRDRLEFWTKMTDAEKEYYIHNYHTNRQTITDATKLIELQKQLEDQKAASKKINVRGAKGDSFGSIDYSSEIAATEAAIKDLNNKYKDTPQVLANAAIAIEKYNLTNDEVILGYVNSYNKWLGVDGEVDRMLRSSETKRSSLLKQMSEDAAKQQENIQKMAAQKQKEAYDADLKAAQDAHAAQITELKRQYAQMEIDQAEYSAKAEAAELSLINRKIRFMYLEALNNQNYSEITKHKPLIISIF